jgi:hypothetical protein
VLYNRPGLPAIDYRVATQPTSLARMLAALTQAASSSGLAPLTTRDLDDPAIAMRRGDRLGSNPVMGLRARPDRRDHAVQISDRSGQSTAHRPIGRNTIRPRGLIGPVHNLDETPLRFGGHQPSATGQARIHVCPLLRRRS